LKTTITRQTDWAKFRTQKVCILFTFYKPELQILHLQNIKQRFRNTRLRWVQYLKMFWRLLRKWLLFCLKHYSRFIKRQVFLTSVQLL